MRAQIQKLIRRFWGLIFRALYYPLAPLYDKISYYGFLGQWPKWQRAVLPRIQGKRVLEIGCGTGSLMLTLLERGYKAYGIDASPAMLKQASKKLEKAGYSGRVSRAQVQQLPFPDDSFETVISTFPTEYIIDPASLKEIQRVLYPGGRLVIVDTAMLRPFNRRARFLIWLYGLMGVWGGKKKDTSHAASTFWMPLAEAGLVRRDETFEDEQGEAHIIIALKVW
ncbi:MAG TPA: class I SAM-dependent methyltransferase [Chloroflexia bacterium]|nr:class I SAM-dependent methyltransferase [Chloroflexia bacterium]